MNHKVAYPSRIPAEITDLSAAGCSGMINASEDRRKTNSAAVAADCTSTSPAPSVANAARGRAHNPSSAEAFTDRNLLRDAARPLPEFAAVSAAVVLIGPTVLVTTTPGLFRVERGIPSLSWTTCAVLPPRCPTCYAKG